MFVVQTTIEGVPPINQNRSWSNLCTEGVHKHQVYILTNPKVDISSHLIGLACGECDFTTNGHVGIKTGVTRRSGTSLNDENVTWCTNHDLPHICAVQTVRSVH